MSEIERYASHQEEMEKWFESLCRRCGVCCGVGGDPCINLENMADGKYLCRVYVRRLRKQLTVSGREFNCVPVRDVLRHEGALPDCAYRKV